jgi:dienelactone hydrolase
MRRVKSWLACAAIAIAATPLADAPGRAAEKIGVVLIHGKQGLPGQLHNLAVLMNSAGYLVQRPEMCWSRQRIYDRSYLDCLKDIDAAVARLKGDGATAVVVAGMSLGGNAALGYGARHGDLKGVIALAPAPAVELMTLRPDVARSVAEAQAMIAAGRGDRKASFTDINVGRVFEVETTANIYVSFIGPGSPGIMPDNAARLKAPLLVVSGIGDSTQRSIPYVFARAPADRLNWHVTVASDHRGTPAAAAQVVLVWLKALAGK